VKRSRYAAFGGRGYAAFGGCGYGASIRPPARG